MRKMNENFIVLLCLLMMLVVGGLFLRQNFLNEGGSKRNEKSQKDKRSLVDHQSKWNSNFDFLSSDLWIDAFWLD